jgi:hypothetical protein
MGATKQHGFMKHTPLSNPLEKPSVWEKKIRTDVQFSIEIYDFGPVSDRPESNLPDRQWGGNDSNWSSSDLACSDQDNLY